jgi:hypothetical protein
LDFGLAAITSYEGEWLDAYVNADVDEDYLKL